MDKICCGVAHFYLTLCVSEPSVAGFVTFLTRTARGEEYGNENIFQKNVEKIWRFKNNAYLCSPFERKRIIKSSLKRLITVQEASTEKIQFIEKR
jgi:hypothetical protein